MLEINSILLYLLLFITYVLSIAVAYILGRLGSRSGVYDNRPKSFFDTATKDSQTLSIDDRKYVTEIKTDHLEKKYTDLGDVKKSEENISSAINKLKNLKG